MTIVLASPPPVTEVPPEPSWMVSLPGPPISVLEAAASTTRLLSSSPAFR